MTCISKNIEARAKLMGKMLDRCDVDIQRMAAEHLGLKLASAVRSCGVCRNAVSCETWLAATAGEKARTPPSFCPNAKVFEALALAIRENACSEQPGANA